VSDPQARRLPAWAPRAATAAALLALIAASFVERWRLLTESPFPVGIDGYYYPIQLRALLETGSLEYASSPLTFWLMAPLAAAADPITGAKLGAALLGALSALPAYALGARLGRGRGAGLLAAVIATRSAGSAYLTIEFVKNGVGIGVALFALWLLLRALEAPPPARGRAVAALGGLIAATLAHKMAAGVVAVIAIPALLAAAAGRGELRGRRLLYTIGALTIAGALAAVLGLLFPQRFLSPADAALAGGLFTADARWGAPVYAGRAGEIWLGHEALAGLLVALAAVAARSRPARRAIEAATRALLRPAQVSPPPPAPPPGDSAAGWAILALAVLLGLPWLDVTDVQGLAFRLRIAAFAPLALAAAMLAGRLTAQIRHRDVVVAGVAALALAAGTPGERDEGRVNAHPALVTSIQAMTGRVPDGATVIVPERHIMFMIAWYLRVDVSLRPDPVPAERRVRVMLLKWIGAGSPLDEELLAARARPGPPAPPLGLHPSHPNGMVLVTEPAWEAIAARLPPGSPWLRWPIR
jgi:Dolichyl-phosphate-mannose-protein mannosyltransferase